MSDASTPHTVLGYPTEYRGWIIWKWTGWRNNGKYVMEKDHPFLCMVCDRPVFAGELVQRFQHLDSVKHWRCAFGDDKVPAIEAAQWLAQKNSVHLVSSYPGQCAPYLRGGCFDVSPQSDQIVITELTSEAEKESAQRTCFNALLGLIDKFES